MLDDWDMCSIAFRKFPAFSNTLGLNEFLWGMGGRGGGAEEQKYSYKYDINTSFKASGELS